MYSYRIVFLDKNNTIHLIYIVISSEYIFMDAQNNIIKKYRNT